MPSLHLIDQPVQILILYVNPPKYNIAKRNIFISIQIETAQ